MYPLGLLPGSRIRLANVIKITSKKGHAYLATTVFTKLQLLCANATSTRFSKHGEASSVEGGSTITETSSQSTLMEISDNLTKVNSDGGVTLVRAFNATKCILTLEVIHKISITAICETCGNHLSKRGSCSFVGCHMPLDQQKVKFECSANFQMEDETYGANVYVKGMSIIV